MRNLLVCIFYGLLAIAVGMIEVYAHGQTKIDSTTVGIKSKEARGLDLLKAAESESRSLDPPMRAWVLLRVARGYERVDKQRALRLLEDALTTTRSIEGSDYSDSYTAALSSLHGRATATKPQLQEQILQTMVPLAPERAISLLDSIDARARAGALRSLLGYYESKKQEGRALEVVYRISAEQEMPYGSASRMMEHMKPQSADFLPLFM